MLIPIIFAGKTSAGVRHPRHRGGGGGKPPRGDFAWENPPAPAVGDRDLEARPEGIAQRAEGAGQPWPSKPCRLPSWIVGIVFRIRTVNRRTCTIGAGTFAWPNLFRIAAPSPSGSRAGTQPQAVLPSSRDLAAQGTAGLPGLPPLRSPHALRNVPALATTAPELPQDQAQMPPTIYAILSGEIFAVLQRAILLRSLA
ncbi:hypothetical protein JANAI61_37430 [Jannaschia sp. AI_61]|nr:hypothetical protein JANAI61_37430 [Jannaschia sp. AI_61]